MHYLNVIPSALTVVLYESPVVEGSDTRMKNGTSLKLLILYPPSNTISQESHEAVEVRVAKALPVVTIFPIL